MNRIISCVTCKEVVKIMLVERVKGIGGLFFFFSQCIRGKEILKLK